MPHRARGIDQDLDAAIELPQHYIAVETSLSHPALRSLKQGDAFAVFDDHGDIGATGGTPEGLYFNDIRFLSRYELLFEAQRPLLLGSVVQDDNAALSVDLANPDVHEGDAISLPRDTISIERTKFLWQAVCYERIGIRNHAPNETRFTIELRFDADFRDLFEIRGTARPHRGRVHALIRKGFVEFRYEGLDNVMRRMELRFHPAPIHIEANLARFNFELEPHARASIFISALCEDRNRPKCRDFGLAFRNLRRELRGKIEQTSTVASSNHRFDEVCSRSISDLSMLLTRTPEGLYPYAGIPWYSTAFGRDGVVTAMLLLWLDPTIAKGVLKYLAATQAKTFDAAADAEPGKILHETRKGEMASLGEVPFKLYYGSVDSTPLFVMLAGMYFDQTGDFRTIQEIWPNIKAAIEWIDKFGDKDGDGFVEYARLSEQSLVNQGWKDSYDSIFHADGSLAEGPIALCEVQSYVYAARAQAAKLATRLGDLNLANKLAQKALSLRRNFEAAFWCEDLGTYALALDGFKRPCRVRTSNTGHVLFGGIASRHRAERVARTLLGRDFFSGWGIRTVANGEARYNPISYHNGSIWPHDNALIALGFARYGLTSEASRLFEALFDAAGWQDLLRLPELFCGFIRKPHRGPTSYPVACAPQAWAAAAPFGFLTASLGMQLSYEANSIVFVNPCLPKFLDHLQIGRLKLCHTQCDLKFHRYEQDVTLNLLNTQGDAKIMLVKSPRSAEVEEESQLEPEFVTTQTFF